MEGAGALSSGRPVAGVAEKMNNSCVAAAVAVAVAALAFEIVNRHSPVVKSARYGGVGVVGLVAELVGQCRQRYPWNLGTLALVYHFCI